MVASFESRAEEARKKEASISYELYRLLKSAIVSGVSYPDTRCEFKDIIPEFLIDGERADLVVVASKYGNPVKPFLVIEVKVRAFNRPGPSTANAARRASSYARNLSAVPIFYAVYDGWTLLAFRDAPPYLLTVCGTIADQKNAGVLLKGLEEYDYRNKSDLLNTLPKHPDPEFLFKRIMPSVAELFAKTPQDVEQLLGSWKRFCL